MKVSFFPGCTLKNKAKDLEVVGTIEDVDNTDTFELLKHLNGFEKMVLDASENFEPCYISRYLLNLCALFNKFYNNYRIIDNDKVNSYRLEIVGFVKNTLYIGLKLLGINAPNAM